MQLVLVFLLDDLVWLAMGNQKAYVVHLGMSCLHSFQMGRAFVSKGMTKRGKSEGRHVAAAWTGKGKETRQGLRVEQGKQ